MHSQIVQPGRRWLSYRGTERVLRSSFVRWVEKQGSDFAATNKDKDFQY